MFIYKIILPEHLTSNGKVNYTLGDTVTLDVGDRTLDGKRLGQDTPVYTYKFMTFSTVRSAITLHKPKGRQRVKPLPPKLFNISASFLGIIKKTTIPSSHSISLRFLRSVRSA